MKFPLCCVQEMVEDYNDNLVEEEPIMTIEEFCYLANIEVDHHACKKCWYMCEGVIR